MNPSATSTCKHKHMELEAVISDYSSDAPVKFVAVTETWLHEHIKDAQLNIEGFNISRSDRSNRGGGGVLLYSHCNYPISEGGCISYDDSYCQALFVKFSCLKLGVFVLYRPPDAPKNNFSNALRFVDQCIENELDGSFQVCLVGDFNFPDVDWKTEKILRGQTVQSQESAREFLTFLNSHFMNQCVDRPTRGPNTLDLFCVDNPSLVQALTVSPIELSDHSLVSVVISLPITELDRVQVGRGVGDGFATLDFSKADYPRISEAILSVDWLELEGRCSLQDYPAVLTETLLDICRQYVPVKRSHSGSQHSTRPREVNALRRRRKRIQKQILRINDPNKPRHEYLLGVVLDLNVEIEVAYHKEKERKERSVIEKLKSNPKIFYSYAKAHSVVRGDIAMLKDEEGISHIQPQHIANALQKHFSSVYSDPGCKEVQGPQFDPPRIRHQMITSDLDFTMQNIETAIKELKNNSAPGPDGIPAGLLKNCCHALAGPLASMWKRSLHEGVVPSFYKMSLVCPLHKKGDKITPGNYRPVSLTSHVVKVFERVLKNILIRYFESNSLISANQHGFRTGRSTVTQLLAHVNDILEGWCKGLDSDCIYLDYAKAFDKVDHALLIKKLKHYSIHPMLLKWIESFLIERSQSVVVNGNKSCEEPVLSGVPQGSVLGPVLFIIFINDLERVVTNESTVRFFADDTRVSKQISSVADQVALQEDLSSILEWSKRNNMLLHEQKFELIVHRTDPVTSLDIMPFSSEFYCYQVSEEVKLSPMNQLRDLGVRISADLSWKSHISSVVSKGRSFAAWVLSVFKSREKEVMMTLYTTYVRSQLEYCSLLWNPQNIEDIELVEGVQRSFTSRISGVNHLNYWDRLKELNLMSLQRRRERFIIIMMWKIINGVTPNDMGIRFQHNDRRGIKAVLPSIPRGCRSRVITLYDESFSYMGPQLWNILPKEINSIGEMIKFKSKLTGWILSFPDRPPIQGYVRSNNNSLLVVTNTCV